MGGEGRGGEGRGRGRGGEGRGGEGRGKGHPSNSKGKVEQESMAFRGMILGPRHSSEKRPRLRDSRWDQSGEQTVGECGRCSTFGVSQDILTTWAKPRRIHASSKPA